VAASTVLLENSSASASTLGEEVSWPSHASYDSPRDFWHQQVLRARRLVGLAILPATCPSNFWHQRARWHQRACWHQRARCHQHCTQSCSAGTVGRYGGYNGALERQLAFAPTSHIHARVLCSVPGLAKVGEGEASAWAYAYGAQAQ
jgi:hypothetical protein